MKSKAFKTVISVLLVLCGILAIAGGVLGMGETKKILAERDEFTGSLASIGELDAVIDKLASMENEYLNGNETVVSKKTVNKKSGDNAALESARAEYEAALEEYNAAKGRLQSVKNDIADAEALVDGGEATYVQNQAIVTQIKLARSAVSRANETNYRGYRAAGNAILLLAKLSLPEDFNEWAGYLDGQQAVAQSYLDTYNNAKNTVANADSLVASAEKAVSAAEADVNRCKAALDSETAKSNKTEKKTVTVVTTVNTADIDINTYDQGVASVDEALKQLMQIPTVTDSKGNEVIAGVAPRLGAYFDFYMRDVDGTLLTLKDDSLRLDYAKCRRVTEAYRAYVDESVSGHNSEAEAEKLFSYIAIGAGALAVIAGALMLLGSAAAKYLGVFAFVAAAAAVAYSFICGCWTAIYPFSGETNHALFARIGVIAAVPVAALSFVPLFFGGKSGKKKTADVKGAKTVKQSEAKSSVKNKAETSFEPSAAAPSKAEKPAEEMPKTIDDNKGSPEYKDAVREYNEALKRYLEAKQREQLR